MENMTETNTNAVVETENAGATTDTQKTYTQDEVTALLQSETDKRVTQALKKQQAKFEKAQSEAEKLRAMDETQRQNYEFEKQKAEFEKQKEEFAITQNKLQASKVLAERNLPIQFVEYIVAGDADTMLDNINTFEKLFKSAVADAVTAKIGNATPKGVNAKQTGITKAEFNKLTLAQQSEIYKTNPSLYKELTNR